LKIGIDLDNTFCTDRYKSFGIMNCKPLPGAIEQLGKWCEAGHLVVLFTHRSSEEHQTDTLAWLEKWAVPYHHLIMDKPHFDLYIGDEAEKFTNWDEMGGLV